MKFQIKFPDEISRSSLQMKIRGESTVRLDKLLANMGHGTRKEVKKFLKDGTVTVNGQVIKDGKYQLDPEQDEVRYQDVVVKYKEHIYLQLHKPQGVVSATEDPVHETVVDILEPEDQIFDLFPVGRLDKDTEGLLVLTNDGKLAHQLLSPKHHVPKKYVAHIQGRVTESDVQAFEDGLVLEDGTETLPAQLTLLQTGDVSEVEVTIVEGKYHQVKRMFAARGKKVIYLKRVKMGNLTLDDDLEPGEYREMSAEDLVRLKGE